MGYKARGYDCVPTYDVTGVVVTESRVSIDWTGGGEGGHLEAESADGLTFRGHYGYPQLDVARRVEFTLFRSASGARVLLGRWWNTRDGGGGEWLFHLSPLD